jgi:hypothetical protein
VPESEFILKTDQEPEAVIKVAPETEFVFRVAEEFKEITLQTINMKMNSVLTTGCILQDLLPLNKLIF